MSRIRFLFSVACVAAALSLWPGDAQAQYPWGWGPPYAWAGYGPYASIRLQVEPRETEVFIDGYYAGTVDDFDGFFQRLRLEPAEHEIELFLPGHRSYKKRIYLQPATTLRIRHTMEALQAGDPPDARPAPGPTPNTPNPRTPYPRTPNPRTPEPRTSEPRTRTGNRELGTGNESAFGTLSVRVQPGDADVTIDGDLWEGPDASERLLVQLPEGEHRIEIRKSGFESYSATVVVRRGETTSLNVSLNRE